MGFRPWSTVGAAIITVDNRLADACLLVSTEWESLAFSNITFVLVSLPLTEEHERECECSGCELPFEISESGDAGGP